MQFDDQLLSYFGTTDLQEVSSEVLASGIERIRVDFGLQTARERRFALWALLHVLNAAPDLDVAFRDPEDRDAARNLMDLLDSRM